MDCTDNRNPTSKVGQRPESFDRSFAERRSRPALAASSLATRRFGLARFSLADLLLATYGRVLASLATAAKWRARPDASVSGIGGAFDANHPAGIRCGPCP